ncbi:MAG TPA: AAA family ATPase [Gemmataceae bacterium]|nr:AAA family ATPase [Gemmataceae bacterium]
MAPLLEIAFGKSPSTQYPDAVSLAQTLPGYRAVGEGRNIVHRVATSSRLADESTWELLERLLGIISAWRSASVALDGRPLKCWSFWTRIAEIKSCYTRREQLGTEDLYCSGKSGPSDEGDYFGCRHVRGVSRTPNEDGNSWIRYGTLSQKRDSFRVDKKVMLEVLKTQTKGEACLLCPVFDWRRVRAEVNELPAALKLGDESPFEVRYSRIDPAKALGIKAKESAHADDGAWIEINGSPSRGEDKQPVERQVPSVRYSDVAGQKVALETLKSVVELPLRYAAYFEALGVTPQTGVLLYGPPGNGKTLLAKAVATESNAHLEIISGPEVLSPWLGQSEENLRGVFARARRWAPSIVLIDELDSLAPRRALLSQHHDVQILSQLLVLLDGLEARGRVVVIGTTNRLEALDPAICRPGRFDYHIEVASPDRRGRAAILRVHLAKLKTRRAFGLDDLIARTDGFSGAELAALCREAGIQAIRRGISQGLPPARLVVTQQDVREALLSLRAKRVLEPIAIPALKDLPTIASTCSARRGKD